MELELELLELAYKWPTVEVLQAELEPQEQRVFPLLLLCFCRVAPEAVEAVASQVLEWQLLEGQEAEAISLI